MNFQNLHYFLVAAEEGSMTHAAERLHMSQQALSGHIARLESELGCRLFTRKPALELTYSGKHLQRAAAQMLDIRRQTETVIGDINGSRRGEVRIGVSHSRGQAILPVVLPAFSRRFPLAELSITEGNTRELEADLEKGAIDVMIGFMPFMLDCAEAVELLTDRLCLLAPRSLLAERFGDKADEIIRSYKSSPDLKLMADMPFVLLKKGERIRTLCDREFSERGVDPAVRLETRNIQTAVALAASGMGLTVCPEMYLDSPYLFSENSRVRENTEVFRFFKKDTLDTIAIGYNRERYLSRMARDLIVTALGSFGRDPAPFLEKLERS